MKKGKQFKKTLRVALFAAIIYNIFSIPAVKRLFVQSFINLGSKILEKKLM